MHLLTPPLQKNSQGSEVENLHYTLFFLTQQLNNPEINNFFNDSGFQDAYKADVFKQLYGTATLKLVNFLQEIFQIQTPEMGTVDNLTAQRLNELLGEFNGLEIDRPEGYPFEFSRGAEAKFSIIGFVHNKNKERVKDQTVIAFDVDLRGAAIYRTVNLIQEIEQNAGFEYLNESRSDINGNYYLEFTSLKFQKAERKKADVIVYAVNKEGEITGRSRLVNSREYSDAGQVRNLEILITRDDQRTEYEIVMSRLLPFLEESQVTLIELAKSNDQVKFASDELDESETKIQIAVDAEKLRTGKKENDNPDKKKRQQNKNEEKHNCENLSHELLYGTGRQSIDLNWLVLYRKTDSELKSAIEKAVEGKIIKKYNEKEIAVFLQIIHECAVAYILQFQGEDQAPSLEKMLSTALPEKQQQHAFVNAYRKFKNQSAVNEEIDYKKFWSKYLPGIKEFKEKPELISGLILTQQLFLIGGNHQPLMEELQLNQQISSVTELIELKDSDWKKILKKTGVPDFIEGKNKSEKINVYAEQIQSLLNAAYPTQKIAVMIKNRELPIRDANVSETILAFVNQNPDFDISTSPVHEYAEELKSIAQEHYNEVKIELNRMQRIFQVSPKPEVMGILMRKNLNSAYTISSFPRKSFIKMHSEELGGDMMAEVVYQRAEHLSTLAAERAIKMYDLSHLAAPGFAYSKSDREAAVAILQNQVSKRHNPNYSEIFGSPDICECEHCRSVYSAAAYLVDLLRFLWRGVPNAVGKSPLDMFSARRPDILHLPLTCENTNTIIPYIDLVNEVMEYYTYHGILNKDAAHDTGETSADELRANPQNFEPEAYRILKNSVYPFSLPYHQPLDVIRTYSDHLKTERYEVMRGLQKDFSPEAVKAIESEALRISEEEYRVLTLKDFKGQPDLDELSTTLPKPIRELHHYFGYANPADVEKMAGTGISDGILRKSGMKYVDLLELIKTRFINPHQGVLEFLQELFAASTMSAQTIYTKFQQINAGALDPSTDADIMLVLAGKMQPADFKAWVVEFFDNFDAVITLFQTKSLCDLDSTVLKTVQNVYAGSASSGITDDTWSKIHRFVRLWRKLGWKIHEVDLMLVALGETAITDSTMSKLSETVLLNKKLKLSVNSLATLWGSIDTYGEKSLYKKLFLNKAVQRIDSAFLSDKFGNYLTDTTAVLEDHIPAMLAAFRMSEEDLNAIIKVARIQDNGTERAIDLSMDLLNIYNLSIIYRYTVLSKALKFKVPDFCLLTQIFNATPFSILSIPAPAIPPAEPVFISISPANTDSFYQLAESIKKAGFKAVSLQYIFNGMLPAESTLGLNDEKAKQSIRDIRQVFNTIEQSYPATPSTPLTSDILRSNLSLSFKPDMVTHLIGIIESQQSFRVLTDPGLPIIIPSALASKYTYNSVSGDLASKGIMSEVERVTLKALPGANDSFAMAVVSLYTLSKTLPSVSPSYSLITDANLTVVIPDELSPKFTYTKASGRLSCTGVMFDDERNKLQGLSGTNTNFKNAVALIYKMPEDFIKENFNAIFAAANAGLLNADLITLLNHPKQPSEKTLKEKLQFVYSNYLPLLKQKLYEETVIQYMATLAALSEETTAVLVKNDLPLLIKSIALEGFTAEYFSNALFTPPSVVKRTDKEINFNWAATSPSPTIPVNNFGVRWEGYIAAPSSGEYTLIIAVKGVDEAFDLYLDDALFLKKTTADVRTSWETIALLNSSKMYKVVLEYSELTGNAGISFSWKTATTAVEIVSAVSAFPSEVVTSFLNTAQTFHRAAKFVSGFTLTNKEVDHFARHKINFDNLDFKALTPIHWQRINHYVALRNAIPQSQASLIDLFSRANNTNPVPSIASLTNILWLATGWDFNAIIYLINTHFVLMPADLRNEIELTKIYNAVSFVVKTGLSAQTLAQWATPETDFDQLIATADLVKSTVKAKYEEEDWLKLAGSLSDKIRENQQQALISYLLTKQELIDWGVTDADGLFEYFLIDVQMGTCMDSSRIVQANAAVQMYVNRCLLNLESDTGSGVEIGVSPEAIDKERWGWMEYYRVWEVNRKIFCYPENWLEPEWRDDRSPFFKELESELTQNDITERSVETAFRNYLTKLNAVANPDVCGMYQENYPNGMMRFLHVFGRTHNSPYQFFYRTCNEFYKWSAWEKVQVDIRMTEDGDNSGVHLMPIVWKNRLFVFWAEFIKKEEVITPMAQETLYFFNAPYTNIRKATIEEISNWPPDTVKSYEHYEIRLAWSEYVDGKWSSKQLTKEYINGQSSMYGPIGNISDYKLQFNIQSDNVLVIWVQDKDNIVGNFGIHDIQSKVYGYSWNGSSGFRLKSYSDFFTTHKKNGTLDFKGSTFLQNNIDHKILFSTQVFDFDKTLNYPFFYQAGKHTYFVRPIDVKVWDYLKSPEKGSSYLIENHVAYATSTNLSTILGTDQPGNVHDKIDIVKQIPPKILSIDHEVKNTAGWGQAFSGIIETDKFFQTHIERGLEFHTFYHPFSSEFVKNLNVFGIKGLMGSDTFLNIIQQPFYNDYGTIFTSNYNPNFYQGLVKKAPPLNDYKPGQPYTYYKENICFDLYGANSIYNWELFFHAPLYIATRLSKNGKYEEAMKWFHYIFDPTTDEMPAAGQTENSRYWKVLPFKTTAAENLEDWFQSLGASTAVENPTIKEWRQNQFKPFIIARNRPLAFMKNVVIKYVENFRMWGDTLFRTFTRESVNEALQLYVIANHILGPRPESVPKRGKIKAETYDSQKNKWDDFSNAVIELENIFPNSGSIPASTGSSGPALLGIGHALYFCLPNNEKLMEQWDTIADRLFKIRHCMDIDGSERQLALFSPPIDPAMLINAASQGLSLGSILSDLSSPPPMYRFIHLIQKANEFCVEVKSLGSALLAALEKKDIEELGRVRASQETAMLDLVTAIKERQVLDSRVVKQGLLKSRDTSAYRFNHYKALLSTGQVKIPAPPTITEDVDSLSQLPIDTLINKIDIDVDGSLVDSDESGIKLIKREKEDLDLSEAAKWVTGAAGLAESIAAGLRLIPQASADVKPLGIGAGFGFGGVQLGGIASSVASAAHAVGTFLSMEAAASQKLAGYIRREQEWTLQANLAAKEMIQIDKQITSADIKLQIAQKELSNHKLQIVNTKQIEQYLKDKFTNQELYQWMKEQLFSVYKQSYNLAYDMAKKVEKCYRYELGNEITSFIQYGYWDNAMQGLCAGEKLQLALRQLEKSYLEENKRELELTKSISMAMLNPLALQELKTTGKCFLTIPEELYDLDYPGHYFRRIKSVSLSLPCIAGPHTSVNCSLRLLRNIVRTNTAMNDAGAYEHSHDEGVWIEDDRFKESNVPVKAIATSTGQRDSGMFELNFRDERYLPFEGAGAISEWKIELTKDVDLRQFDYSTISDIILHISYTAREDAGLFKESAVTYLKNFLMNTAELSTQPLMRMFSLKHEFSTEWNKFLYPVIAGSDQSLAVTLKKEHFPFFTKNRSIDVSKIEVLMKSTRTGEYKLILKATDLDDNPMTSLEISMPENATFANMQKATVTGSTDSFNAEEINIMLPLIIKLRHKEDVTNPQKYNQIDTSPEEISDLFVVIHYKLGDIL